ncbi:MAG: zinc-dependent metalloprotease [Pirellulales bacterium]
MITKYLHLRARRGFIIFAGGCVALSFALFGPALYADEPAAGEEAKSGDRSAIQATSGANSGASATGGGSAAAKQPEHAAVLKDLQKIPGLITLYHKDTKLIAELNAANMNTDFIILASISRGIGRNFILAGMYTNFGDDWLLQFRKVEDRVLVVRRNVRFRAKEGSPESRAVELAYTDSVLFSLPILAKGPGGGDLVDFSNVFMTDLPQLSQSLPGFSFSRAKSTWEQVKGFKDNVELEVAATYASSGSQYIESVPDTRGVTINVHYSISKLPQTGYKPREADPRVGYFLTAVKDFSKSGDEDRFVRYINRWDLRKADPEAELSPPKKPIVFWLEKTIPYKYRKPIREGIEEWNKAFEKAGFVNAIEVRQQPDNADWDPEDINYNTFRWITAGAGFAIGPTRVNPTTGEILDADILFDADFVEGWRNTFDTFTPESIAAHTGGPLDLKSYQEHLLAQPHQHGDQCRHCMLSHGHANELALGRAVMMGRKNSTEEFDKVVMQGLKEVAMHEVGHTLGLRHNFKASTMLPLEDLHNVEKTRETGLSASVMDYLPVNLAPKGQPQGDYFTQTIGPYDFWAIEYGYKPVASDEELKKIAARSGEPELQYATDEDTRGIDPDPLSSRFDMGKNPIEFAKLRAQIVSEQMPDLLENSVDDGENWSRARNSFNTLLATHGTALFMAARTVGGIEMNRSHKGDKDAPPPFNVVGVDEQRAAMQLLEEQVFSEQPFSFPPELYNHLAPSRWSHWGADMPTRTDYPVHGVIEMWQDRILQQLLSSLTLTRMHDSELRVPVDQDAFTTAELLERLTNSIFEEVNEVKAGKYTTRKPAISSMRRNLQRSYLKKLSDLALGNTSSPQDCQTIAYMELKQLQERIDKLLGGKVKLDPYSQAHLEESSARIGKVLDAKLTIHRP